jgi:hypothetical protein
MSDQAALDAVRAALLGFPEPDAAIGALVERIGGCRFGLHPCSLHSSIDGDSHTMETLQALLAHLGRQDGAARAVVSHNFHPGDARATQMGQIGELNLGQLVREPCGRDAWLVRARVADRFDTVIHIDDTSALAPLERWAPDAADLPDTYPSGM